MKTKVAMTYREHLSGLIEHAVERGLLQALEIVPSGYVFLEASALLQRRLADAALPYAFHFVEGSLGSADFLENNHCDRTREFLADFSPIHISDHLTACRAADLDLEMNLPILADEQALDIYCENVAFYRRKLGASCAVLLEHVPNYFTFHGSTMSPGELYARVIEETGCGALVDLHNLYCDELNRGDDAIRFLDRLPASSIAEVHLAGGRWLPAGRTYLDGHDGEVPARVWELLDYLLARAQPELIVLERENNFSGFDAVLADLEHIQSAVAEAEAR